MSRCETRARRLLIGMAALMSILVVLWTERATADARQVPGSRIQLDLPASYQAATLFSGFMNKALGISFAVFELPEMAYDEVAAGMTPETLAQRGIRNAERGTLPRTAAHIYMRGAQPSPAGNFAKFFVVFREGGITALVTANVQQASLELKHVSAAEIEQVLVSARVVATAAPAKELFRLGYLGAFKPTNQFVGTARMYSLEGAMSAEPLNGKATLVVSPSIDSRLIAAPEEYAEQLIMGLTGLGSATVLERRRTEISAQPAFELVARALDRETGQDMLVYQVLVLLKGGGYFRIVGQAPASMRQALLPELQRIAASFELRP